MNPPKITIITPSFNQGKYLAGTIESILTQDYPALEYMVIDGGSDDDSVPIIEKYRHRLAYWASEPDSGQSEAINKGLRKATGEIITWINSDDQLLPGALRAVATLFAENPAIDLVHGKTILFGENQLETLRGSDVGGLPYRYLAGMAFPQPASFFSARAVSRTGFLDESLHYGMDFDFFARMFLKGDFLPTGITFSKYLLHDQGKSLTDQSKFAAEWAIVYSKVLRSLPHTESAREALSSLNLYCEGQDSYSTTRTFDSAFIEKTLLYFIQFQIVFYYQAGDLERVRKLTKFLRKRNRSFFEQVNMRPVHWRSRLLPPSLLQILRKI